MRIRSIDTASQAETQHIVNNAINQVRADVCSFPHEFAYNAIYDSVYNDTLVYYCHSIFTPENPWLDIAHNYWGNDGLDTLTDLHPEGAYIWDPVWNPTWGEHKSVPLDATLFKDAEQAIICNDFATAELKFKEIIEDYPDSKYIQASLKELLALKRIYDQDFEGLQQYLNSVPTLWDDDETAHATEHVINWCNIEKEDYISAIDWFEAEIEEPVSYEDSICAIIDLGYTYTLMDGNGSRSSSYVGRYPEYKFATRKAYEKNRAYLIDLLFKRSGNSSDEQNPIDSDTSIFSLIQNFPNPFRDKTDIKFTTPFAARVSVKVYNVLGALVEIAYDEFVEAGEHLFSWSPKNLSDGIYYYSLEVNNEKKEVKKMILLR